MMKVLVVAFLTLATWSVGGHDQEIRKMIRKGPYDQEMDAPHVVDIPVSSKDSVKDRKRACEILFAVDDVLWEKRHKNMTHLVDMAHFMVNGLNDIFIPQVFKEKFNDIYFRLARVQVVFGLCDVGYGSANCTAQRGTFLKNFDEPRDFFADFCLAYVFTYRDFHNGTAGLASVGTVCRKYQNSGFVTFENYGSERTLNETVVTFAHEVAHSFNASHDEDLDPCKNETKFIMGGSYDPEVSDKPRFSECSIDSMTKQLKALKEDLDKDGVSVYDNCFKEIGPSDGEETEVSLCGNQVVEPGEECDCGLDEEHCWDPCCFPARVAVSDKEADNKSLSCMRHKLPRCVNPSALVYGIYAPLIFICLVVIVIGLVLRRDWKDQKRCFTHITHGNVRINVKPTDQTQQRHSQIPQQQPLGT